MQRQRESEKGRERERESLLTWPQGVLTSLSFFLPHYHVLHQSPTQNTNLPNKQEQQQQKSVKTEKHENTPTH